MQGRNVVVGSYHQIRETAGEDVEMAKRGKNTKIAEPQFRIVVIGRTVFKGLASGPGGSWNTKSLMTGPLKTHLPMG